MEQPKKQKKGRKVISTILGGRIFMSDFFLNNVWLILLVVFYAFIYVSNRYAYRQELSLIKQLKVERQDVKYQLLTKQSEFSEKSRQSNIEKFIRDNNSNLNTATNPPYSVK